MPPAPFVLIITLGGYEDLFVDIDKHLISELQKRAELIHSTEPMEAHLMLAMNLSAVLITDPGIMEEEHKYVLRRLVEFVKAGGTAVFAGQFSSFVRWPDLDKSFEKDWSLPWRSGSYTSGTYYLRPGRDEGLRKSHLLQSYDFKAFFVKNIRQEDAVYGHTRRNVLPEAPVVYTKVEEGWLGYCGDVGAREGSTWAVLAMLGLGTRGIPPR